MNIYFVNRQSKLKGPFDIIDSYRQHIIKVGDICLRDTIEGVAFYVVYKSANTWNDCKLVGVGRNDTLSERGNTLLFSFDGLSKRKGDIALIKQIMLCFREKAIDDFLGNAVEILEYKRDLWDGSLFPKFFASTQELIDRNEVKKSRERIEANRYPSIFAKYLSEELFELLIQNLNEGRELKEAYMILREKHPDMFRKALIQFLSETPNGTIFDKPDNAIETVKLVKEIETKEEIQRDSSLYDNLLDTNKRIAKHLIEISRYPLLSKDEEVSLIKKYKNGNNKAIKKLVMANMRFVVSVAKQFLHKGMEFEDLLQEGYLGLINAVDHYNPNYNSRFFNYAQWWIRRFIADAIIANSLLIKVPLNTRILHRKVNILKDKYEQQNGFLPSITDIEIDNETDFKRASFLESLPYNLKNMCILCEDLDVFEENYNIIKDYEDKEQNKYFVRNMLIHLSIKEKEILTRVFGIGKIEETLEFIGDSLYLTRERVRQIKEKAIKDLREMIFAASTKVQSFENQTINKEDCTSQTVTTKNIIEETQTLKEVKKEFSKAVIYIDPNTKNKNSKFVDYDRMILSSEKTNGTSSKDGKLNTCNYTIVNYNGKCNIYNHNNKRVYSSTGFIKEINKAYYRVSLTFTFFSIGLIKRNLYGEFINGANILLANRQTKLHHKLNRKEFIESIEDIKCDGKKRVKVEGCWYDERGNAVFEKCISDSNNIGHHGVTKESTQENNIRKSEDQHVSKENYPIFKETRNSLVVKEEPIKPKNEIDELKVTQVFVDTSDTLPYREVEVEIEQPDKNIVAEVRETFPVWTFAENLRFSKRSKQFLKCKCRVGLSKTGYYLIVNQRFIKLGDYPDGYECNVGNIWIKKPIDNKGYRMVHENGKGSHLIGYAIEKGKKVVFTNLDNDVFSITFDGRTTSGTASLKDSDLDMFRHAFDKKATSYNYFWFLAILKIYRDNREDSISFKDILIKMVSIAWKYVFVVKCQFRSLDQLPVYLRAIQAKTYLFRSANEKVIEERVQEYFYELNLNTLLMPLLNNVPYRFLSPWIPFASNDDVKAKSKIVYLRCPYSLHSDHITINPIWGDYFVKKYYRIFRFIEEELKAYLKCK